MPKSRWRSVCRRLRGGCFRHGCRDRCRRMLGWRVPWAVVRDLCPRRIVENLVASGEVVFTRKCEAGRLTELERLAVGQAFRSGVSRRRRGHDRSHGNRPKKKSEGHGQPPSQHHDLRSNARLWRDVDLVDGCPDRPTCQAGSSARSIATGTWSDGFSQARTCFSMEADENRLAASGDNSRWSMRMPLFFCQAPA